MAEPGNTRVPRGEGIGSHCLRLDLSFECAAHSSCLAGQPREEASAFGLLGAALCVGKNPFGDRAGVLPDRRLDLGGNVRVGLEEALGVLAPLADALAVVGE